MCGRASVRLPPPSHEVVVVGLDHPLAEDADKAKAKVTAVGGGKVRATSNDGRDFEVDLQLPLKPPSRKQKEAPRRILQRVPLTSNNGVENMDNLSTLHEASILDNIERMKYVRPTPVPGDRLRALLGSKLAWIHWRRCMGCRACYTGTTACYAMPTSPHGIGTTAWDSMARPHHCMG